MRDVAAKPVPAPSWARRVLQRRCAACGKVHAPRACSTCESRRDRPAARDAAPASVQTALSESGRPLAPAVRGDMERRFGHDFSSVRVHTGAAADASAREVDAQAYTVGWHTVFANGRYRPEQPEGRRLLAHELTHVVQQRGATHGVLRYAPQGEHRSAAEGEAERNAARVDRAEPLRVTYRFSGAPLLSRRPNAPGGCGVCQLPMHAGTQAHSWIGGSFVLGGSTGRAREKRIAMPGGGKGRTGRLDLALIDEGSRSIYTGEVKPRNASGMATGRKDQIWYRKLAALDPTYGTYFHRNLTSRQWTPQNPVGWMVTKGKPTTCGQILTVTPSAHGLWLYECTPPADAMEARPDCACAQKKKSKKKKQKPQKQKKGKQKKPSKQTKAPKSKKPPKLTGPKTKPPKAGPPKGSKSPPTPANVGFGISIFSTSGGAGNAGVGVAIFSNSTSFGTAGAGISIFSDSIAAGAAGAGASVASTSEGAGVAGAGASVESSSTAAGAAGAGVSESSSGVAAGAAGAGSAESSSGAAAGAAGVGEVKDSDLEGAGSTGKGSVKGSQVSGKGGSSSGSLENVQGKGQGASGKAEAKDVSGTGAAQPQPQAGETEEEDEDKPGGEAKAGGGTKGEGKSGGTGPGKGGAQGAAKAGEPQAGAGTTAAPQGEGAAGEAREGTQPEAGTPVQGEKEGETAQAAPGATNLKDQVEVALGIIDPDSKPEDREKAAAEAAKVNALLKGASTAQKALLAKLAQQSGNQYRVPASQWVERLMQATKDITEADLEYLMTLDWTPGNISAEELRKRVLKALENKDKPKAQAEAKSKGEAGAKAEGAGTAGAGKKQEGSAPPGEGSQRGPESGKFTVGRKFTGERKDVYERDYQFVVDDKAINARTKVGDTPTLILQFIGDDKKAYYYRLKYRVVEGPIEETDKNHPGKKLWRFKLETTNTDLIDVAPEGQRPFVITPRRPAAYRIFKP